MNKEMIKKKLLKDKYIDFAYDRYLSFKETPQYDESYKLDILESLNGYFIEHPITEESVVELARKIQTSNPNSGTFVHWNNTKMLVSYAEDNPDEAAKIWRELYDESTPLIDRITKFREKMKSFDGKSPIAALFAYLLAAYDYTKYPLYNWQVFQEMMATYELDYTKGTAEQNYTAYFSICEVILEYLQTKDEDITMLEAQGFLYCTMRYEKLKVEIAADYLYDLATTLHQYQTDPSLLLDGIMALDKELLHELHDFYRDGEKVRKIRFLVIDKIIQEGSISISDLNEMKEKVSQEYDTNILHSWDNFKILFHLYYHDKKNKVRHEQGKIHYAIRHFDIMKDFDLVEGKTIKGFNWNQSFGDSRCWIAVYEEKYTSHRFAPQFFFAVNESGLEYGLMHGDNHSETGLVETDKIKDVKQFTYEQLEEKMSIIAEVIKRLEPEEKKHFDYYTEDFFDIETWLRLLKNRDVFYESDLVYLKKMYEMGGKSIATELTASFGEDFSFLKTPVISLTKRIYQETDIEPLTDDAGKVSYWQILFNGKDSDKNNIIWYMKENLYEAVAIYLESGEIKEKNKYSKTNFLNEVFIDEDQYDTMVDLLGYKRNIILQGPPGVGKTFIAKRLAHSLIGEVDNERVQMIQFHQSYAYEDFVMGLRPLEDGGFHLKPGVFYEFCEKALEDEGQNYYFIIDEINRGNLSKIFGELFMLIEGDKRDEFVTMGYTKKPFTVPSNVYLIGTMNTADRSLAQLEVALRRRFAFITLTPAFNKKWRAHLRNKNISDQLIERIELLIDRINQKISDDFQLGVGYEIGHSFFTNVSDTMDENTWFDRVIQFELKPLLEEYYFDRLDVVDQLLEGY